MDLYLKTSYDVSKAVTKNYSTSFSIGIAAFAKKFRSPIYAIYGFVRLADEIVDTFHEHNKKELLDNFRKETFKAIEEKISLNPILHSFQKVFREFNINHEHINAFLDSMEMDLFNNSYERNKYDNYIYGSAEVVGLMCLKVFVEGNETKYKELESNARSLGSAFQKVNFLRDIKSDIEERGRIYLPGVNEVFEINNENKRKLEKEIELEFKDALNGIKKLPAGVKLGVYTAYLYYIVLFSKIRNLDVEDLKNNRVRVSTAQKFALFIQSLIEVKILKQT